MLICPVRKCWPPRHRHTDFGSAYSRICREIGVFLKTNTYQFTIFGGYIEKICFGDFFNTLKHIYSMVF